MTSIPLDLINDEKADAHQIFINTLTEGVIEEYGTSARLPEIEAYITDFYKPHTLEDGVMEGLCDDVRDEITARDNGRRR